IFLLIGTLTMLGMAGSIILFVVFYQKRLLQSKITIQQMEAAIPSIVRVPIKRYIVISPEEFIMVLSKQISQK
ncbi:MAG: hypothetical protein AAFN93_15600, partial [Bacteroidota bacterium]